jgi:hypothetical protein
MSDFRFACPHCGQRIACDASLRGTQTTCPNCQNTITVPAPAAKAGTGPSIRSGMVKISGLAVASLICSCFLSLGCIPGIICGHLSRARIRRNPSFVLGNKLALAGLIIGYASLAGTVIYFTPKLYRLTQVTTIVRRESEEREVMKLRGVDEVMIGDWESENQHQLQPGNSGKGDFFGRHWRGAMAGGRFSYVMKVLPDQPMTLNCRYWGSDTGGRVFEIRIEDKVIAVQTLDQNVPERFFDVEYKIPRSLTRGKSQVVVEFRGTPGLSAGGVFGCQMLKR